MTLDQLIFHLDVFRAQCGTGDIPVLFRDPDMGMLYDEVNPQLCNVQIYETYLFDAFDMNCGDVYVEL
jgi:hypothetical protein